MRLLYNNQNQISINDSVTIGKWLQITGEIRSLRLTQNATAQLIVSFLFQILVRGNIVSTGSVQNAFAGSEYEGTEESSESLIRITTIAPPPPPTSPNTTLNWTEETTPPAVALSVDIESSPREKREAGEGYKHAL